MSGFYMTISTEDEERLWNVNNAPAVPDVGELIAVSEAGEEQVWNVEISEFRVLRREWIWQEQNQTYNVTIFVEPVATTP